MSEDSDEVKNPTQAETVEVTMQKRHDDTKAEISRLFEAEQEETEDTSHEHIISEAIQTVLEEDQTVSIDHSTEGTPIRAEAVIAQELPPDKVIEELQTTEHIENAVSAAIDEIISTSSEKPLLTVEASDISGQTSEVERTDPIIHTSDTEIFTIPKSEAKAATNLPSPDAKSLETPDLSVERPRLTLPKQIIAYVQEIIPAKAEKKAEQVEIFVASLTVEVQKKLVEYIISPEQKHSESTAPLIMEIAEAADRLNALAMDEALDTHEAVKIEELLVNLYTELLDTLDVEVDDDHIENFIELVQSENYQIPKEPAPEIYYDPMHERKFLSSLPAHIVSVIENEIHHVLGRFVVQQIA